MNQLICKEGSVQLKVFDSLICSNTLHFVL